MDRCIFFPFKDRVSGTLITIIDLYMNLKDMGIDIPLIIKTDNVSELLRFSIRDLNKDMFLFDNIMNSNILSCDLVITSLQTFSYMLLFNKDFRLRCKKLIILDTADFVSVEYKHNLLDELYRTIGERNVTFLANKHNVDRYIRDRYDYVEYYHKLNPVRLGWSDISVSGESLSTNGINGLDVYVETKRNGGCVHRYKDYYYERWSLFGDIYYENIGKMIYEYIYHGKQVHYSPNNKMFDDGLTGYLNLLGVDDNMSQTLDLCRGDIEDKLLMKTNDPIIGLL